jgi:ribose transport system permease protein
MPKFFGKFLRDYNSLILCLAMLIISSLVIPNFLSSMNMINILVETSIIGIMAIGMTFLLLIGLFDMSIGNQVSLVSLIVALTMHFGIFPSIIISLLAGMFIGAINGFITTKLKINAFIVTFAMLGVLKGVNLIISGGNSKFIDSDIFNKIFNLNLLGIPIVIIVFFIMAIAAELVLRYTKIGFEVYVSGGNIETAKLSGINTFSVTMFCFTACSFCVAIATMLLTSRVSTATAVLGEKYTLLVITACIIGGVKFTGGYGNIFNTFFGVLAMQLVNNIMYMTNTSGYVQSLINGAILLIVLSVDKFATIRRSTALT